MLHAVVLGLPGLLCRVVSTTRTPDPTWSHLFEFWGPFWRTRAQYTCEVMYLFCREAADRPGSADLRRWSGGFYSRFGDMWDTAGSAKKAFQTER